MKISRKKLLALVSEAMREQREEPGLSHARSELAYGHSDGGGKTLRKKFNKASRRQSAREISWSLADIDGDGDFDLENVGGEMTSPIHGKGLTASGEKAETGDIIIGAGIIDAEGWAALSSDEHFEDPKFGRKTREGTLNKFMMDLAYNIASGEEQRLKLDQIRKLADLNPEWARALDQFDADIADEMRRQEFMQENLNESRERVMSENFGRNDIKAFFAQTLYEDFETSKPRKRRGRGVLTEATIDHAVHDVNSEALVILSQALVAGFETLFGENLSKEDEYEHSQDFRTILEKNPEVTNKLHAVFMEMGPDNVNSDDDESAGAVFGMPRDKPEADSGDKSDYYREEILRQVGSEVYNNMDSTSLKRDDLQRLVGDMIAAGRFSQEDYDAADINWIDVVERVEEFEREYGDDPSPRY